MNSEYDVQGMTCASCQARVEKAVKSIPGVTDCRVSLLTARMTVCGDVSPDAVSDAVKKAGYGAALHKREDEGWLSDRETPRLAKRLFQSVFLLILLMVLSLGHGMLGMPLPAWCRPPVVGIFEAVLAFSVLVINRDFFIKGFGSLLKKSPNMDTLVALGASCSYGYSLVILCLSAGGESDALLSRLYFETAAMIPTLITVGKLLEAKSRGKTVGALRGLLDLRPKTVHLVQNGEEKTVPIEQLQENDLFAVRPGEKIPTDGTVVEGIGDVNEAVMTGESIPAEKKPGDGVLGGTINGTGYLLCRATRVGKDTTLSQIIHMVEEAASTKAPIARLADRAAGIFVPVVIGIAVLTAAIWLMAGQTVGFALARAVSVLVISCPCSLGLATPVAVMVGSGMGAKHGILFKTSAALEAVGKVKTVVCDKTGTVTEGKPAVTDICPEYGVDEKELLSLAVSLEAKSEHPLGRAIAAYGQTRGVEPQNVADFKSMTGRGVSCRFNGTELIGGSRKTVPCSAELDREADLLSSQGKTPMLFRYGNRTLGMIAVADVMKSDAPFAVQAMKSMGLHTVLLTGDNAKTASAVGSRAGFDEVIDSALPHEKARFVNELAAKGTVCMVGDGINDAPALSAATVGMAIGAGADVAIDAADIVLQGNRLSSVWHAIRLSRATLRIIRGNLFWAFFYNALGIPLAAGVFYPLFGWLLNPMVGAAAMSASSICVVLNALRLNRFRFPNESAADHADCGTEKVEYDCHLNDRADGLASIQCNHSAAGIKKDNAEQNSEEDHIMAGEKKKVLTIEGMMCGHCEQHVVKALLSLNGITDAKADHVSGKAEVMTDGKTTNEELKKCVEDQGYRVITIEDEES